MLTKAATKKKRPREDYPIEEERTRVQPVEGRKGSPVGKRKKIVDKENRARHLMKQKIHRKRGRKKQGGKGGKGIQHWG